jgi:RNA polymerase sigma-70 factor (sigma-E family)
MDHEDFDEFVAARWVPLFRLAYLLTADAQAAEDLLRTAMERTFARWPTVVRAQAPEAHVRRLMVNAVIPDHRRQARPQEWLRARRPERAVPAGRDEVEDAARDHLLLWPLVCALPERQRAALVLRYYEDLSESDAADVLGWSVRTLRSETHDAMRALQRGLAATSTEAVDG